MKKGKKYLKVLKIFDQFQKKPGRPKLEKESQKTWYEKLKQSIVDVFWKRESEFKLDKKALNATKRFVIDLKKSGMNLFNPSQVLDDVKPLVLKKFQEYPKMKQINTCLFNGKIRRDC